MWVQRDIKLNIRKAVAPTGFDTIGLQYRGYDIYIKPYLTYLLFYTIDQNKNTVTMLSVLKEDMDWEHIIRICLKRVKNRWP